MTNYANPNAYPVDGPRRHPLTRFSAPQRHLGAGGFNLMGILWTRTATRSDGGRTYRLEGAREPPVRLYLAW